MKMHTWIEPKIVDGKLTKWNWMVQHVKGLSLGKSVDIGAFTYIQARYGVEIQDNVQIGSHCSIYSHSTIDGKKGKVRICKGAKIGTHSTIMPGVTIGEHAIIGAYSFVNKDVKPRSLAFGIPVKLHGLTPVTSSHASEERNPPKHTPLRSYRSFEGYPPIHPQADTNGFSRRRVKIVKKKYI